MGSKTESTSNSTGSGFQDVQDTNSLDISNLQVYKSVDTDITFAQTDHGAIDKAISLVEDEAENTRIFSAGVVDESFALNEKILDAAGGVLVYADEQQGRVLEFTADQLEDNRIFSAGAIGAVSSGAMAALASNERVVDNAFTFVAGGFTKAADLVGQALFGNQELASDAISQVTDLSSMVLQDLNEQSTRNIQAVSDATRSDAANSLDKVVKLAGVAFVVLGLTTVFLRVKA